MNDVLAAALVGGLGGSGLFLVLRGVAPRPVSIEGALRRLERPGQTCAAAAPPGSALQRLTASAVVMAGNWVLPGVERDLGVCERTPARHATEKLMTSLVLALLPAMLVATKAITADVALVIGVGLALVGFVVPDLTLRSAAKKRRDDIRAALSAYLDMANVLLAGGAGIETAVDAAAQTGDGPGFRHIRSELLRCRALRAPMWSAFERLGDDLSVEEFSELASSIRLAGEQGARIRTSLAARAAAMRGRQQARIEADAQSASERMGIPTVVMFFGFMVLVGYPAARLILDGF
jgi:Flp pilus assembly protein TadB